MTNNKFMTKTSIISPCRMLMFAAAFAVMATGCKQKEESVPVLSIEQETLDVPAKGGTYTLSYGIENAAYGSLPEISSGEDWIQDPCVNDDLTFTFAVDRNESEEAREGSLTLSYPGAEDRVLQVMQAGAEGASEPEETEDLVLKVENITAISADITVTPASDTLTYVLLNGLKGDIDSYADDAALIEYNLSIFQSAADSYGVSLEYLLKEALLRSGVTNTTMDTFVPETDYYIYAYGIDQFCNVTTKVYKEPFVTSAVTQYDTNIDIVVNEIGTREIKASFRPESTEYRYLAGYFTEEEFSAAGDFIPFMINETNTVIYMNNALGNEMTWNDVTYVGDYDVDATGLQSECEYVFWAFGVEEGYSNTVLFSKNVTTKAVEITDDCDFTVEILSTGTYSVDFTVTPSSASTRYVALVSASVDLVGLSGNAIADACINSLNEQGIDWSGNELIYQGTQTLQYEDLQPNSSYNLIFFGVNTEGERTTEVVLQQFMTEAVEQSDMEFDIKVTAVDYANITVDIIPTVKDEGYVYGVIPYEMYESFGMDADAMLTELSSNYTKYAFYSGTSDITGYKIYSDVQYNYIKPGRRYVVFAFGQSYWYPTTGLYTVECSTPEREVSGAKVDIILTVFDGDEMTAYDPVAYPKDRYAGNAVIHIQFQPNSEVAEWYGWLESRSADYMSGVNYDILLQAIKTNGSYFSSPTPGTTTGILPWGYQNYSVLSLGVDADGLDGEPVIESLCVTRDQAVPFDPDVLQAPPVRFDLEQSSVLSEKEQLF